MTAIREEKVVIRHIVIPVAKPFAEVCARIESRLGKLDYDKFEGLLADPEAVRTYIREAEGPLGLMVFNVVHHGAILKLAGVDAEAVQYVVGNPMIAQRMTLQDVRAGLYAPLRVYVRSDGEGQTVVEYDLPSSLFGQFGNVKVDEVAKSLDERLAAVLDYVQSDGASANECQSVPEP
jgi:uncharacterized protein (DUF302 family)